MTEDKWKEAQTVRELFLKEVINPLLPRAKYAFTVQNGDYETPSSTYHGILATNELLNNSLYEWKKKRLIHFSTLKGLSSIIESGFLRMSDFTSLDDKEELSYASEIFKDNPIFRFDEAKLKEIKSQLYSLSACESNPKTIKDTFMWENYASRGSGVIIEFSISDKDAHLFTIGKIKYGKEELKPLEQLKLRAEQFYNNHKYFPHNSIELFSKLKSFHKSLRYKNEQEIRILFSPSSFGKTKKDYPTIYSDINSKNEVKTFNRIYLKGRTPFKASNTSIFPEISIHRVILGYELSIGNKLEIARHLRSLKSENLNFEIYHIDNDLNLIDITRLADLKF